MKLNISDTHEDSIEDGSELSFTDESNRIKVSDSTDSLSSWTYLGHVGQIGFAMAIPIAGGVLCGSWIDTKYGTYPKATLSLLFTGVVLSFVGLIRTVQDIIGKKN